MEQANLPFPTGEVLPSRENRDLPPVPSPEPERQRTGSRILPAAILVVMFLAGLAAFLRTPEETPTIPRPAAAAPEESAPDMRSEDCFRIQDGELFFLPDLYHGNGVVTVPNTVAGQPVTMISDHCFSGCSGLVMIILPDGITRVGDGAFSQCPDLRGVALSDTVTFLGESAFRGDTALESVLTSAALEEIGQGCFEDCDRLRFIFYPGSHEKWQELYREQVTPYTYVSCYDGFYPQIGE